MRNEFEEANTMNYRDNTFDLETPLCSFGPGGEFTAHWSELLKDHPEPQTRLGRVLTVLAEVVTATAASGLPVEQEEAEMELSALPNIRIVKSETIKGVHIKAAHSSHSKATGTSQARSAAPGQLMLFGLDAGTGGQSRDKQDNGVRTHNRPAKKKSALRRAGQGTLFEGDPSRAIPA
jgi:hypothetical protein